MSVEQVGIGAENLRLIDIRTGFIEQVRQNKTFVFRRKFPYSLALRAFTRLAVAGTELYGRENLDYVQSNLGKGQFIFAPRHASDADHHAIDHILRRNGYAQIANRLRFVAGIKMWDRPQTRYLMPGLESMPVPAPGYFDEAYAMLEKAVSEKEKALVRDYIKDMRSLGKLSFNANEDDWKSGKTIPVVYIETTRSREDMLERARPEVVAYFKNGLIIPVMSEGVADVFPVGRRPRWEKIWRRKFRLRFWVGEPINARVLQSAEVRAWLRERDAKPTDFVASRIAILKPDRVNPVYLPLYQSQWEGIPEGLLMKVAA